MDRCFKCGIDSSRAVLTEAITSEGIVKVCNLCSSREGIPEIKRNFFQQKVEEIKQDVDQRIQKTNYLNSGISSSTSDLERQEGYLKEIIGKNFEGKFGDKPIPRPDLFNNFNWIVMRARRSKHLTQGQLAKIIGESEEVVKMVEKGFLPDEGYDLVHKLEAHLSIRLIRDETRKRMEELLPKTRIGFDPIATRELTINDLIDLKKQSELEESKQEESETLKEPSNEKVGGLSESNSSPLKENDGPVLLGEPEKEEKKREKLSQKDIDDLIFGR